MINNGFLCPTKERPFTDDVYRQRWRLCADRRSQRYCPLMVILQAACTMVLYLYKYFIFFIKICMLCCCFETMDVKSVNKD